MIWLVLSLIVLIGAAEYYSLYKLPGFLSAESRLLSKTAEPEASFVLRTTIRNNSRFPATLLTVTERIPPAAKLQDPEMTTDAGGTRFSWRTWLMPRQQLVKEIPFKISARGCYIFRGSSLFVGDFTGIKGTVKLFDRHEEIVVYPPLQDPAEFADTLGGYLGEISVRRFILEDPVLTIGLGEYTGREPMRAINWKQTARSGQTMVNKYDHTTDLSVTLILNLSYAARYEMDPGLLERTLSCSRSVVEELEKRRIRYCFCSNMLTAGSIGEWLYVPEGLGPVHRNCILEGLGRATLDTAESAEDLLERVIRHADRSSGYILITPDGGENAEKTEGAAAAVSGRQQYGSRTRLGELVGRLQGRSGCPVLVLAVREGGIGRWC